MIKKLYIFLFICITHGVSSNHGIEIFLLKSKTDIFSSLPNQIKMGVVVPQPVYFKLVREGTIVRGSIFGKGLNIIELESAEFFQNPGTYEFVLATKKNHRVKKRKISITFRFIDKFEPSKIPGPGSDQIKMVIPGQSKNIGHNTGPLNPYTLRYENLDGINLFGIISKLIKKKKQAAMRKKLAEIRSRAARCRKMIVGFYPEDRNGNQEPITVLVTLAWENIDE